MPAQERVLYKRNLIVTSEEYTIIMDALEVLESKISYKIDRCQDTIKMAKLIDYQLSIQELLTDLAE